MENAHYSKPRFNRDAFTISHYAGDVAYDAFGFVAKNNDKLQADLSSMLNKSNGDYISIQFYPTTPLSHSRAHTHTHTRAPS